MEKQTVKVRVIKSFSLKNLTSKDSVLRAEVGYEGEAIVFPLGGGKNFYSIKLYNFDLEFPYFELDHDTFEKYIEIIR
ncbi:hypothetical protein EDM57_04845 [Brevibacillus gelatini]|uniref:Uncharacterized protein n=1 Tax=Brevibacillus gelatini TaxID=1655277 RepID=A0A3M8B841_9BACL|nr:hypothetical protein [Brevibacillus gelatini]RNB59472.1 hypothetical protein EDM57_04845 [Brevibacillus gelatini]